MSREEKCLRVVGTVHFGSGEITPPVFIKGEKNEKDLGKDCGIYCSKHDV